MINNLDQSSGLVNVSYSGDPERFVDCGHVVSYVKNLAGERTYDFPASRAQQSYEVMTSNALLRVDRTVALEGRANVILEEISAARTRVTVNVRYVLTRHVRSVQAGLSTANESTVNASFSSGDTGTFSGDAPDHHCQSTGELERQILAATKP